MGNVNGKDNEKDNVVDAEIVDEKSKRIPQQMNVDTLALYKLLQGMKEDVEFISYKDLSEKIGQNVQKEAGNSLRSARRRLLNEDEITTVAIPNDGIKKVDGPGLIAVAESNVKSIRKKSHKTFKILNTNTKYKEMTELEKTRFCTMQTVAAFLSEFSKEKKIEKIENKVSESCEILPIGKTLELFQPK